MATADKHLQPWGGVSVLLYKLMAAAARCCTMHRQDRSTEPEPAGAGGRAGLGKKHQPPELSTLTAITSLPFSLLCMPSPPCCTPPLTGPAAARSAPHFPVPAAVQALARRLRAGLPPPAAFLPRPPLPLAFGLGFSSSSSDSSGSAGASATSATSERQQQQQRQQQFWCSAARRTCWDGKAQRAPQPALHTSRGVRR